MEKLKQNTQKKQNKTKQHNTTQSKAKWNKTKQKAKQSFIKQTLRGYCTSYQKLACFVLYFKIINTFLKNNICILKFLIKKMFKELKNGIEILVGKWFLKVDMPILTCIFFTFNWLTLTSEMHFVKFHPVVASCLLSRGKRKYAPLGMRLIWKYIRNYFLVYQLISPFLVYLQNYNEFEAEILDLQSEKYGLSFDIKNILLPVEP